MGSSSGSKRQEAVQGPSQNPRRVTALRGVCAQRTYWRGIGAQLDLLQVGVVTPGGAEAVENALASTLAEDRDTVIISVDMVNAFNSFHQVAMFAAVQQSAPALLPTVPAGVRT